MVKVTVKDNESIDRALKRFKKKLEKSGVIREYRVRRYFEKPSAQRKVIVSKARYKQQHLSRAEQQ